MLSFQNISLLSIGDIVVMRCQSPALQRGNNSQQQAVCDQCDPPPPDGGLAAWQPVGNTDQPPSCPELCPFYSLPITFTYQGPAAKPDKPPAPHVCRLP